MKKTRKLIPAIAMLLMSTVMMSTASYAWFSMNTEVTASGMKVEATTSASLVINKTAVANSMTAGTAVSWSDSAVALKPITYMENTYKYCDNTGSVAPDTGLAATDKTLTFEEVGSADGQEASVSYKDYLVYLSAAGATTTATTLKATVSVTDPETPTLTQLAITIDFWIGSAVEGADLESTTTGVVPNFTGATRKTTNLKTVEAGMADVTLGTSVAIPLYNAASGGNAIPVLMRVYYDGALENDEGASTYVRSNSQNLQAVTLSVAFSI